MQPIVVPAILIVFFFCIFMNPLMTESLGGFTGQYIKDTLIQEGVKPLFVEVDGITRVNVKVKSQEETEINAVGL